MYPIFGPLSITLCSCTHTEAHVAYVAGADLQPVINGGQVLLLQTGERRWKERAANKNIEREEGSFDRTISGSFWFSYSIADITTVATNIQFQ